MIFWILLGIASLIILISVFNSDFGDAIATLFTVGLLFGMVVTGLGFTTIGVGVRTIDADTTEHYELSALATRTHQPGAYFFLGSGVSEEKPVYRYIEVDSTGGNRMKQVDIDKSVVYEVSGTPRLEIRPVWFTAEWLLPFSVQGANEYAFSIPEGSIVSGYEVAP